MTRVFPLPSEPIKLCSYCNEPFDGFDIPEQGFNGVIHPYCASAQKMGMMPQKETTARCYIRCEIDDCFSITIECGFWNGFYMYRIVGDTTFRSIKGLYRELNKTYGMGNWVLL